MPDDQTAVQPATFDASFSAVREEISFASTRSAAEDPSLAVVYDPVAQSNVHLRTIQQMYASVTPVNPRLLHARAYCFAKRALDLLIAVPALLVLSPLFLIVALLVRLDSPGPALFVQQRIGQHGRPFWIYKFRTMTDGCGVRNGTLHKRENDARVTRVGKILRQTSIDELPQLLNVALGEMSLVGPRPEIPSIMIERYEPWQYKRLQVPQGITGWWQVTGRGKKMLWKHTKDDLYYIEHASFLFDLKLLLKTVRVVINRNGAF